MVRAGRLTAPLRLATVEVALDTLTLRHLSFLSQATKISSKDLIRRAIWALLYSAHVRAKFVAPKVESGEEGSAALRGWLVAHVPDFCFRGLSEKDLPHIESSEGEAFGAVVRELSLVRGVFSEKTKTVRPLPESKTGTKRPRRRWTMEFKMRVMQLATETRDHDELKALLASHGVSYPTFHHWHTEARAKGYDPPPKPSFAGRVGRPVKRRHMVPHEALLAEKYFAAAERREDRKDVRAEAKVLPKTLRTARRIASHLFDDGEGDEPSGGLEAWDEEDSGAGGIGSQ